MTISTDDLRAEYLSFFEERDHTRVASDSLVPEHDPSILFTGAGMNQFKDQFMGRNVTYTRATSSQKCIRTLDLETVGKTASHHTFFEMLGNFSFGDYFKEEAIGWAWEFLIERLKIEPERLSVSVYEDDDVAFKIWNDSIGLPGDRIHRLGEKDNYWPASAPSKGPNGPCGPCSEIFFDQGVELGCERPDCGVACDCDRHVEIWNLVFTQFERKDGGVLDPLPSRNIDTGMGLERTSAVLNGCANNFEIDLFLPVVERIEELAGVGEVVPEEKRIHIHRIADHVRCALFMIGDGVRPGSEKQAYVLRKVIRRAIRDGNDLAIGPGFMARLVEPVLSTMKVGYPELVDGRQVLVDTLEREEEQFRRTVDKGMHLLEHEIDKAKGDGRTSLSGRVVFDLKATHGFPSEVTQDVLDQHRMTFDPAEFEAAEAAHVAASGVGGVADSIFDTGPIAQIKEHAHPTVFDGYHSTSHESPITGLVQGDAYVQKVGQGECLVVVETTPFYAEAGGQVGDTGWIRKKGVEAVVLDTQKTEGYHLHRVEVTKGTLHLGDHVTLEVDVERRARILKNHTATHLLHKALRSQLGDHVAQKGSLVAPDRLRFDFSHGEGLGDEQVARLEDEVNARILDDIDVVTREMALDEARRAGAMALFGEKYGDNVRVVSVGDYSMELCGGIHVDRTGQIGVCRIEKEEALQAGVRRIVATTGPVAVLNARRDDRVLGALEETLKTTRDRLPEQVEALLKKVRSLEKDLDRVRQAGALEGADAFLDRATEVGGSRVVAERVDDATADDLRGLWDHLRQRMGTGAALLVSPSGKKVQIVLGITRDLTDKGLDAGKMMKGLARIVGGGGSGRPDLANGGGKDPARVDELLETARRELAEAIAGS